MSHKIKHGASLNYSEGQFTSPLFSTYFIFKITYAAINLRMTENDKYEGIWVDDMATYFVLPEGGRHRLQRMSVITV